MLVSLLLHNFDSPDLDFRMFSYFYWKTITIIGNTDFLFCLQCNFNAHVLFQLQRSIHRVHLEMCCIQWGGFVFRCLCMFFFFWLWYGVYLPAVVLCVFWNTIFLKTVTILTATLMNVLFLLSSCLRLQTYCDLRYHSKHRGCFNGFCSLAPSSAFFERWLYCTKALE